MGETALNAFAQQLVNLTLNKTRYDNWDLQWFTEGPFWRRTSMNYSRDYKQIPDYEIGDLKHGKSLQGILDEAAVLHKCLLEYKKTADLKEMDRVNYLIDHVANLLFRTRMLCGENFTFDEMTQGLYGVVCPETNPSIFEAAKEELNNALPGSGEFNAKVDLFKQKIRVKPDALLKVIKGTTKAWHDIAVKNMNVTGNSMPRVRVGELPNENMVFLSILFGYDYNHLEYERTFNLLYPWTVDKVMEYVGHEMEPGHLTCFEKRTQAFIDTCWPEMSIISQHSTSNSLGEGSARYAANNLSFNNSIEEMIEFEKEFIFEPAAMDVGLLELMPAWHKFCEVADYGKLETSRHYWNGDWSEEECIRNLEKYGFVTGTEGVRTVKAFATDDPGHYVAHYYARDLVKDYFNSLNLDIPEQWEVYEKLCSSHMTLKDIKEKKCLL